MVKLNDSEMCCIFYGKEISNNEENIYKCWILGGNTTKIINKKLERKSGCCCTLFSYHEYKIDYSISSSKNINCYPCFVNEKITTWVSEIDKTVTHYNTTYGYLCCGKSDSYLYDKPGNLFKQPSKPQTQTMNTEN